MRVNFSLLHFDKISVKATLLFTTKEFCSKLIWRKNWFRVLLEMLWREVDFIVWMNWKIEKNYDLDTYICNYNYIDR